MFASYAVRSEQGRKKVSRIVDLLEPYHRMDWLTLNQYILFVWGCIDTPGASVSLPNWRKWYDDAGLALCYI